MEVMCLFRWILQSHYIREKDDTEESVMMTTKNEIPWYIISDRDHFHRIRSFLVDQQVTIEKIILDYFSYRS